MNSLEFIDREIKYEKENIKLWTPKEKTSKRLEHLNQIKAELEAWYEIKDLYKKGYFSRIALPMESHEKLKKALEVKENVD